MLEGFAFNTLDLYQVLGVEVTASRSEIISAYDQIEREYKELIRSGVGDDSVDGPRLREEFAIATEAFRILSNAERRRKYDDKFYPSRIQRDSLYQEAPDRGLAATNKKVNRFVSGAFIFEKSEDSDEYSLIEEYRDPFKDEGGSDRSGVAEISDKAIESTPDFNDLAAGSGRVEGYAEGGYVDDITQGQKISRSIAPDEREFKPEDSKESHAGLAVIITNKSIGDFIEEIHDPFSEYPSVESPANTARSISSVVEEDTKVLTDKQKQPLNSHEQDKGLNFILYPTPSLAIGEMDLATSSHDIKVLGEVHSAESLIEQSLLLGLVKYEDDLIVVGDIGEDYSSQLADAHADKELEHNGSVDLQGRDIERSKANAVGEVETSSSPSRVVEGLAPLSSNQEPKPEPKKVTRDWDEATLARKKLISSQIEAALESQIDDETLERQRKLVSESEDMKKAREQAPPDGKVVLFPLSFGTSSVSQTTSAAFGAQMFRDSGSDIVLADDIVSIAEIVQKENRGISGFWLIPIILLIVVAVGLGAIIGLMMDF